MIWKNGIRKVTRHSRMELRWQKALECFEIEWQWNVTKML
jgi:hypothetical protein